MIAGDVRQPTESIDHAVEPCVVLQRPSAAPCGDRKIYESRVQLAEIRVAKAPSVHRSRGEVLDDYVALRGKASGDRACFGRPHVEGETFLSLREDIKGGGAVWPWNSVCTDCSSPEVCRIQAALNKDDLRTKGGKPSPNERRSYVLAKVQDPLSFQRKFPIGPNAGRAS